VILVVLSGPPTSLPGAFGRLLVWGFVFLPVVVLLPRLQLRDTGRALLVEHSLAGSRLIRYDDMESPDRQELPGPHSWRGGLAIRVGSGRDRVTIRYKGDGDASATCAVVIPAEDADRFLRFLEGRMEGSASPRQNRDTQQRSP
jgi:hypothetical protein